jgi:hypothetical protein
MIIANLQNEIVAMQITIDEERETSAKLRDLLERRNKKLVASNSKPRIRATTRTHKVVISDKGTISKL